LRFWNIF